MKPDTLTRTFNGLTFHYWPASFNRKADGQKLAARLRSKGYKVRLLKDTVGQWQPFTNPRQRKLDR